MPRLVGLATCGGLLAAAALLGQVATTDVGLAVGGVPLPDLCGFHRATGLPCPGCGLTRSWVDLARCDLAASLHHHRLGWLVMLYVAAQALRHGLWLAAPAARGALDRGGSWLDRGLVLVGVALAGNWALTLLELWW